MKKLLFLGLLTASLSANAQILGEKVENAPGWFEALPDMFTTDNKAYLLVDETSYHEYDDVPENFSPSMKVYDDELKLIKSIDIPSRNIKRGSETKESTPTGIWGTVEDRTYYDKRGNIVNFEWCDFSGNSLYDDAGLTITQTLFNSDDKYEYIRTIFQQTSSTEEYDRNYDGEVDWITTYYEVETAGFEIVNEDGDVLQSIRYESRPYDHCFYLVTINDKCYLAVEMENEDYSYTYEWYALTPGSSTGLKKVQAPVSVTARPAMAKRHESITIETTGDDKNREVNIVDASGKSVWKQTIPAGQKSIRVNAAKLSKGLNVVNVDGKKDQSVKVIVN